MLIHGRKDRKLYLMAVAVKWSKHLNPIETEH